MIQRLPLQIAKLLIEEEKTQKMKFYFYLYDV